MDRDQFEGYITEAIALVPAHIRQRIENVAFVIDDQQRGNLLGLYRGIPLPQRGQGYTGVLPDTITLYQLAIEDAAGPEPEQIRKKVHEVVHHEIGHYFGFSEQKVRAWEKSRRLRSAPTRRHT
jgi:predicted Zn-dependent protease with MMP-like domain